jgi:hypothetical protein
MPHEAQNRGCQSSASKRTRGGTDAGAARFGGTNGAEIRFEDEGDLVVVRTKRRGSRHDVSPLTMQSREAREDLRPCFGFPSAGVGVYAVPEGRSEELSNILDEDPEIEFAGRGLRDQYGAPVVYTENLFVKFADDVDPTRCEEVIAGAGLSVKRLLGYATNAFFVEAPPRTGRRVFSIAAELLDRDDVELCHPEVVREISWNRAFPEQWHLRTAQLGDATVDAHASVAAAWELARGEGIVIAVVDDGVDVDHVEFSPEGKIVAPRSVSPPRAEDPRPGDGDKPRHGMRRRCLRERRPRRERRRAGRAPDADPVRLRARLPGRGRRLRMGGGPRHRRDLVQLGADRRPVPRSRPSGTRSGRAARRQHAARDRVRDRHRPGRARLRDHVGGR